MYPMADAMTNAHVGHTFFRPALWLASALLIGGFLAPAAAQRLPSPGDWEYLEWRDVPEARRTYICLSDSPPSWCVEWREWRSRRIAPAGAAAVAPENDETAATQAAAKRAREMEEARRAAQQTKAVPDDEWEAVMARVAGAPPVPADLEKVTLRAFDDGDAAAFEVLGYVYATGWGAAIDYGLAYEYYGRAFLAGATDVKANLDGLWGKLTDAQRRRMKALFEEGTSETN